jgi:protein SCO1/2
MGPLLALSLLLAAEPPSSRLAVIQRAPDFTLTTQDDKPLALADFKGKVVLVSFVFTTCNGTCPATTSRMVQVQQELVRRGHAKKDTVRLVSITVDPTRDTPDVLKSYMKRFGAESPSWTMLTGSADDVAKVCDAWGIWTKPAAGGQLDHPSRIFLVDQEGRIREIYDLGFLKPAWVLEDIELLLNESK